MNHTIRIYDKMDVEPRTSWIQNFQVLVGFILTWYLDCLARVYLPDDAVIYAAILSIVENFIDFISRPFRRGVQDEYLQHLRLFEVEDIVGDQEGQNSPRPMGRRTRLFAFDGEDAAVFDLQQNL